MHSVRDYHFKMVSKGLLDVACDGIVKVWFWWNGRTVERPY